MAEDAGVDLVEVAPNAVPPVCRLMDYGKFRYQEQKKAQEAKAKQKVVQIKEVKFRPATDENDFQTKLRSLEALPLRTATRPRSRCASADAKWLTSSSALSSWTASVRSLSILLRSSMRPSSKAAR